MAWFPTAYRILKNNKRPCAIILSIFLVLTFSGKALLFQSTILFRFSRGDASLPTEQKKYSLIVGFFLTENNFSSSIQRVTRMGKRKKKSLSSQRKSSIPWMNEWVNFLSVSTSHARSRTSLQAATAYKRGSIPVGVFVACSWHDIFLTIFLPFNIAKQNKRIK